MLQMSMRWDVSAACHCQTGDLAVSQDSRELNRRAQVAAAEAQEAAEALTQTSGRGEAGANNAEKPG